MATQDLFFWIVLLAQIWHKSCVVNEYGLSSDDTGDERIGRLRDEVGRLREELSRRERENDRQKRQIDGLRRQDERQKREIEHLRRSWPLRVGRGSDKPPPSPRTARKDAAGVPVDGLVRSMAGRRAARARHGLTRPWKRRCRGCAPTAAGRSQ